MKVEHDANGINPLDLETLCRIWADNNEIDQGLIRPSKHYKITAHEAIKSETTKIHVQPTKSRILLLC